MLAAGRLSVDVPRAASLLALIAYPFAVEQWITTPDQGQAQLVKDQKDWESYVKTAKIEPQG